MISRIPTLLLSCSLLAVAFSTAAQEKPPSSSRADRDAKLAEFLKRAPESDSNKDGTLTFEEFKTYQQKRLDSPEMKSRIAEMLKKFPQADTDKDGELNNDELRAFQAKRREIQEKRRAEESKAPRNPPTFADVAYGDHEKQRFDLWTVPDAKEPTPLVIFIHGGGFRGGDKRVSAGTPKVYLDNGVAFASMNYRLSDVGPYPIMMNDAVRGLQTIRHRAAEWNIDPERIVCYGGSAGAGISLWLAFHDDLADPDSEDPIARQSSRILAAGTMNGQSTYDIHTYRDWFGVPDLPLHDALYPFYGVESEEDFDKEPVKALMKEASAISHLSDDDTASVYMTYNRNNTPVTRETDQGAWVHHVLLGLKLKEAMEKKGMECIVTGPDVKPENDSYGTLDKFLINKVKKGESSKEKAKE